MGSSLNANAERRSRQRQRDSSIYRYRGESKQNNGLNEEGLFRSANPGGKQFKPDLKKCRTKQCALKAVTTTINEAKEIKRIARYSKRAQMPKGMCVSKEMQRRKECRQPKEGTRREHRKMKKDEK